MSLYSFQISSVKFLFKDDFDSSVKNVEKSWSWSADSYSPPTIFLAGAASAGAASAALAGAAVAAAAAGGWLAAAYWVDPGTGDTVSFFDPQAPIESYKLERF